MFRWIGEQFYKGAINAEIQRAYELRNLLRQAVTMSNGINYPRIISTTIPFFTRGEIENALLDLVETGEIRREGRVFHAAA
jgi:hypothetical protein